MALHIYRTEVRKRRPIRYMENLKPIQIVGMTKEQATRNIPNVRWVNLTVIWDFKMVSRTFKLVVQGITVTNKIRRRISSA